MYPSMSNEMTSPRQDATQAGSTHHNGASLTYLRHFARDRGGASAVEFAIVGGMFITTIVFVMMLGLLVYMGQALDRATAVAARQIMTGAVQKQGLSQSAFLTTVVCPALPAIFICGNVIVNIQTVPEAAQPNGYYAFANGNQTALLIPTLSNASSQYNPGIQTDYVYLQVIYPITILPKFMMTIFGSGSTFNGSPAYLSISTTAFRNEQY